jgi:lysozyme family protein
VGLTFDRALHRLLPHEGGYVNDPNDPGGETKFGISKRSYPHVDIANLTWDGAAEIYLVDFWIPLRLDGKHDGVAWQLFDFAVNSGIPNAIRAYQKALGVSPDGHFGPVSQKAADEMSETDQIMLIVAERLDFMTGAKNWPAHGKGWARRIATNLRYGAEDS